MTSSSLASLAVPFTVKSLTVKNRIVMAPMTRFFSPQGVPRDNVADYYRRRAAAEVGLILSEGTVVDRPGAPNHPDIPHFHGDAALAGWQAVIDAVHAAGGKMGPQIWHVGAKRDDVVTYDPPGPIDSPSGLSSPDKVVGEPMTDEAIADTIASFGRAAADARRLGFDTVEIHGAHGYLIDEFFWSATNHRTDQFGGATIKERARFAAEVVKSVRRAVGDDFPIILRLSQWKQQDYSARLAESPDAMLDWLTPLVDAGADMLHCSQRRIWEPEVPEIDGGEGLNFAGWAKKLTGVPTISVGSIGLSGEFMAAMFGESSKPTGLDAVLRRLDREEFDLVAVGRPLIADASWAAKALRGEQSDIGFSPAMLGELI